MQTPTKLPYKIAIEIDIDCQELLDAVGLPYTRSEDDNTQNVVWLELDEDDYEELYERCPFEATNEQFIGCFLLNYELGEYTTKVTIYKSNGDNITFE